MKPEVLAVKFGYNPNSSSIGIWIKLFIYQAFVISILLSTVRFLLNFKKKKPSVAPSSDSSSA
jgi:hypothetical protein